MIALLIAAALALGGGAFGDRLARGIGLRPGPALERVCLGFVLFIGTLMLGVFTLAVCRALTPWTCLGLAAAMSLVGLPALREGLAAAPSFDWKSWIWPPGGPERSASILILLFLGGGLLMALAPPTGMDTGVYHFTIPKIIVQNRGLVSRDDIWIHKSGGFYMVSAFGMALGGEILAKLLGFAFAVAGAGLAACAAERLRPGCGRAGAFLVVAAPLSAGYLGYEYLELPILTFVLAGLLALLRASEGEGGRWTILCCGFAGLALSCKSSAFPAVILVPAVMGLLWIRERLKAAPVLLAAGAVFAVTAGFWPAWNWATTGSPFYAYPGSNLDPEAVTSSFSITAGIAATVWSITTSGRYWMDSAGPFILVGLAGFWVFLRGTERRLAAVLAPIAAAVFVGGLALLSPAHLYATFNGRYFAPFLIGFGAPAAAQFVGWVRERPGPFRSAILAALLIPALPLVALKSAKAAVGAPAALGPESRSSYLRKKIETFEACERLNALPAPDVKVLFMGIRPYYLDRPFVWVTYVGPSPFFRGLASREDFVRRLREQGFTHVLYEPMVKPAAWFDDPDAVFTDSFRELGRWPWKGEGFVRIYAVETR